MVDANGRRGALDYRIRPLTNAKKFCGVALTVWTRARDNLAPYAAIQYAKPGDVMVIATDDYEQASVVGDVLVGMAKNQGVAAFVTDGMVRDIEGLNAVGIPVFARGLSPNSPYKDGPGTIGLPISLARRHGESRATWCSATRTAWWSWRAKRSKASSPRSPRSRRRKKRWRRPWPTAPGCRRAWTEIIAEKGVRYLD